MAPGFLSRACPVLSGQGLSCPDRAGLARHNSRMHSELLCLTHTVFMKASSLYIHFEWTHQAVTVLWERTVRLSCVCVIGSRRQWPHWLGWQSLGQGTCCSCALLVPKVSWGLHGGAGSAWVPLSPTTGTGAAQDRGSGPSLAWGKPCDLIALSGVCAPWEGEGGSASSCVAVLRPRPR